MLESKAQRAEAAMRAPEMARATPSGIELPAMIDPAGQAISDPGRPAEYPFTRGIFADGFRGRLWTFRQYSGFGSAEESNKRYHFLLEQGQTGLSVALDLPTQCGYDPIHPMARPAIQCLSCARGTDARGLSSVFFRGCPVRKSQDEFTKQGGVILAIRHCRAGDKRVNMLLC